LNIADSFVSTAADLKALHVAMNAVNARLDAVAKEAAAQLAHQKEVDSSIKKLGETESKNHKSSQDSLAQARDELSAQLKKIENQLLEHIKQQNAPKGENVDVEAMRQQIAALQKQWTDNEKVRSFKFDFQSYCFFLTTSIMQKLSSALEGRVAKVEESLLALTSQANLIEERLLAAEKAVFAATSGIQNLVLHSPCLELLVHVCSHLFMYCLLCVLFRSRVRSRTVLPHPHRPPP
jgi:small-conductance mechanosensitive channel